ncbi:hypothetical protein KM043_012313 [Ampulex compressa]|nr:hypothetical protein KM043_012313 [Ampulex compressa]
MRGTRLGSPRYENRRGARPDDRFEIQRNGAASKSADEERRAREQSLGLSGRPSADANSRVPAPASASRRDAPSRRWSVRQDRSPHRHSSFLPRRKAAESLLPRSISLPCESTPGEGRSRCPSPKLGSAEISSGARRSRERGSENWSGKKRGPPPPVAFGLGATPVRHGSAGRAASAQGGSLDGGRAGPGRGSGRGAPRAREASLEEAIRRRIRALFPERIDARQEPASSLLASQPRASDIPRRWRIESAAPGLRRARTEDARSRCRSVGSRGRFRPLGNVPLDRAWEHERSSRGRVSAREPRAALVSGGNESARSEPPTSVGPWIEERAVLRFLGTSRCSSAEIKIQAPRSRENSVAFHESAGQFSVGKDRSSLAAFFLLESRCPPPPPPPPPPPGARNSGALPRMAGGGPSAPRRIFFAERDVDRKRNEKSR